MNMVARFRQLHPAHCRSALFAMVLVMAMCLAAPFPGLKGKVLSGWQVSDGLVFDPTNFADSAPGTFGNTPRTLCCNPPINNWDMGLFKDTAIGEKVRLEFRTEIFNIFNHAQFYGVDGGSANPTFAQPQKVRDPRLFQFALKLVF